MASRYAAVAAMPDKAATVDTVIKSAESIVQCRLASNIAYEPFRATIFVSPVSLQRVNEHRRTANGNMVIIYLQASIIPLS